MDFRPFEEACQRFPLMLLKFSASQLPLLQATSSPFFVLVALCQH